MFIFEAILVRTDQGVGFKVRELVSRSSGPGLGPGRHCALEQDTLPSVPLSTLVYGNPAID